MTATVTARLTDDGPRYDIDWARRSYLNLPEVAATVALMAAGCTESAAAGLLSDAWSTARRAVMT